MSVLALCEFVKFAEQHVKCGNALSESSSQAQMHGRVILSLTSVSKFVVSGNSPVRMIPSCKCFTRPTHLLVDGP